MAKSETVRLTHANGATVSVSKEMAEQLIAGGQFSTASASKAAAKKSDD